MKVVLTISSSTSLFPEQTIPGLDIALSTMKEGEKATIYCKPNYAFGSHGNPMVTFLPFFYLTCKGFHSLGIPIPGDCTLKFELEFLAFDPPELVFPL